jgi:AraC-like DNA-binding protein
LITFQVDLDHDRGQDDARTHLESVLPMMLVPLPFLVSLLLAGILVHALRRDDASLRAYPLFPLLLSAYAVQSVLTGVRWGYGILAVLPVMATLAAVIAPLAWLSFRSLTRDGPQLSAVRLLTHFVPAVCVFALTRLWPGAVSPLIVMIFAAYGAALLWLSRAGPDGFEEVRFEGVALSHRAAQVTGWALLASAATDVLISMDVIWMAGANSPSIVAMGNLLAFLGLAAAASLARSNAVTAEAEMLETESAHRPPAPTSADDKVIADEVEALMQEQQFYRDTELNLGRIARRLKRPARDVSRAINRVHGVSVSQFVNTHRVTLACQLLKDTDANVTRVMFDAGFLTKSNFNREFLRVTGTSPTAWRQMQKAGATPVQA